MSYLLAFLGISALILLHELGHFTAAKAVGMRVERFALFFGPMLLKRTIGETEYGIGVIPLGGYAKISGMNPEEELPSAVWSRAYCNQPVWKRIVVVAAGPFVNFVIAFVIAWFILFGAQGVVHNKHGQPIVTDTVAAVGSATPAAGKLHPGDRIVAIDGVRGSDVALRNKIGADRCAGAQVQGCKAAKPLTIEVIRHGRRVVVDVTPAYNATDKRVEVGFAFAEKTAPIGALYAAGLSGKWMWQVTSGTVSTVARIFEPKERKQLHSVVGIYSYAQQYVAQSSTSAFEFLALISLALGIINLFPFLPLDGGHIFWAVVEKVRGRRVPLATIERASWVGIALIVMLVAVGLTNDISAIAGKGLTIPK
jgi:regulator of sigma E protease